MVSRPEGTPWKEKLRPRRRKGSCEGVDDEEDEAGDELGCGEIALEIDAKAAIGLACEETGFGIKVELVASKPGGTRGSAESSS